CTGPKDDGPDHVGSADRYAGVLDHPAGGDAPAGPDPAGTHEGHDLGQAVLCQEVSVRTAGGYATADVGEADLDEDRHRGQVRVNASHHRLEAPVGQGVDERHHEAVRLRLREPPRVLEADELVGVQFD